MKGLRIIIAGGSGFVGTAMAARWAADNKVIILTRGVKGVSNAYADPAHLAGVDYLAWDGRTVGAWAAALDGADILVNLAGKSVNCRYNARNKAEIMASRVDATHVLGEAVKACAAPPALWINGGSATIYPHATSSPRDESFKDFADDFSVQVCRRWEETFDVIALTRTRKIILRMAIVLGKGGVMVPYRRLARLGLGGAQGNGRQMFSWIHLEDLCRAVEWMWANGAASGTYNAAAPISVSNSQFMRAVRSAVRMPFGLPAPAPLLALGAALIGTETELLLKSRWVLPARLLEEGFSFIYSDVQTAIRDVIG